jgi:DNA-binding transcriptional regulator PaaX
MKYTVVRSKPSPVLMYIIKGLIPYTSANIKLAYKPNAFFNELERIIEKEGRLKASRNVIESTYYRAKNDGYFNYDASTESILLTEKAHDFLALYEPEKLKGAKLLVTFDISETDRHKRAQLRQVLRILKFTHVQKSVWISEFDGREPLKKEIVRLGVQNNVIAYEAYDITNTL